MLSNENEKEDSSNPFEEREYKQLQVEAQSDFTKRSTKIIENFSSKPKLLVWSSHYENNIEIVELETKQEFANFDGVKLYQMDEEYSWTHVKEIANTPFLVSLHHGFSKSANLEVFDVSRKGQAKKIYSFEEMLGVTGHGEIAYNPRRSIFGAMCIGGKIAYQLFTFDPSRSKDIVKFSRSSKWHSQHSTKQNNFITSLNFDASGETAATIDRYGTLLLSDVNTHNYSFHMHMKMIGTDNCGRCRWSTNADEPLLFVKYAGRKLNILDAELKVLILKYPIEMDNHVTTWIDVCQSNGNLLASGGRDKKVKIFDKRESKIVQTFDGIHEERIKCVRWSPSGDLLASASDDKTVALLDFKAGKKLYTGETSDRNAPMSVCFI